METTADPSATSPRYPRLRPGPGLSREVVAAHQQARLHQAMIEIVAAHGYEGVTVRGLAKRAHISTGTFYRYYSSTEDCLLCAYDEICTRAARRMTEAARDQPDARRRLTAAIDRLYRDMLAAPQVTTFMLRGAPTVGPAFTTELSNSAKQLGAVLEFSIRSDSGPPMDPILLEGILAGVSRIGGALKSVAGEAELREVTAEAVEWILALRSAKLSDGEPPVPVSSSELETPAAPGRRGSDDWGGPLGDERAMILAATFRIARSGYHHLSISRICREAGVSRREFNRHFECLDHAFVSALEEWATGAMEAALRRADASVSWTSTIRDVLSSLCGSLTADPEGVRAPFVDITAAGTRGIDATDHMISQVAQALQVTLPSSASDLVAEASASAAWAILPQLAQNQDPAATDTLSPLLLLLVRSRDRKRPAEKGNRPNPSLAFPLFADTLG